MTVTDADGRPLADAVVRVAEQRHVFVFGNIGFDLIPLANGEAEFQRNVFGGARGNLERLGELYVELFNTATLPFYWRDSNRQRGRPTRPALLTTARWFAERGVAVKGHPLVWHTLAPGGCCPCRTTRSDAIRARITRG